VSAIAATVRRAGAAAGPWRVSQLSLVLMAGVAGMYQAVQVARANNDTFLHLAMSRQLLGGDLPVRDFFDSGLVLMYALSAAMQQVVGYRLLAEAIVVGVMAAAATWLASRLVLALTGSTAGALITALVIMVATPRPYSYPKLIVYGVLAPLWWSYVVKPTSRGAIAFGLWTAAAFYFRPDHGVVVAFATVAAVIVSHGPSITAIRQLVTAGVTALLLVTPWFLFVNSSIGFGAYVQSGLSQGQAEQFEMSGHNLPPWPIRSLRDTVRLDEPDTYAPEISLRWAPQADLDAQKAILLRYKLTLLRAEGDVSRVRLSGTAVGLVRELINEPQVADTSGIDRASATIPWSSWSPWNRLGFRSPLFRLRVFPPLDQQDRASDAATVIFYAVPGLAIALALGSRRRLTGVVTTPRLLAFSVVVLAANFDMIRSPYDVRTVDAVVLPAILVGFGSGSLLVLSRGGGWTGRTLACAALAVSVVLIGKSVAGAGEFGGRVSWLAGEFRDMEHLSGAWSDIGNAVMASPPDQYWRDRPSTAPMQLAMYARDCVPANERLMVLWFAPEIYYFSDRLMAQRHLVFIGGWAALDDEQRLTLEKVRRSSPPLVFASADRLDDSTRKIYPALVEYVHREYEPAGTVAGDETYIILARRDRPPLRQYGDGRWPCYVP